MKPKFAASVSACGLVFLFSGTSSFAQVAPSLGTSQSFAVLGGSTVTNTGASVITGSLGVSPGSAVTGFPPGLVVGGTINAANAVALQAQNDVTTAYNSLAAQACTSTLTGQDLGGMTLTPGVYCFASSAQLTGTLTLNALGNPAAVFIFKIGSTLTTASGAIVSVINGGQNCNVFWQVGSSATLGTSTTLIGNILALTSITLNTTARVFGRALARNGAVTLDTNTVAQSACVPVPGCPAIVLAPATLPNATQGVAYSQQLTASGGTAPYTFSVTSGVLPAGTVLSTAGLLSGTPTTAGTTVASIRATAANACFQDLSFGVLVLPAGCPAVTLAPATLPNATQGVAYSQQLTASGGTAPHVFTISSGALPAGLSLTSGGLLSGTPTAAGSLGVTIRATSADACAQDVLYTLVVGPAVCPVLTLSPATLPNATQGVFYSQQLSASGGTAPYVFTVSSGTLPEGLVLTSGGLLSGMGTTAATSTFSIRVADANACPQERSFTLPMLAPVPTLAQWSVIGLIAMLSLAGFLALRRRQALQAAVRRTRS